MFGEMDEKKKKKMDDLFFFPVDLPSCSPLSSFVVTQCMRPQYKAKNLQQLKFKHSGMCKMASLKCARATHMLSFSFI